MFDIAKYCNWTYKWLLSKAHHKFSTNTPALNDISDEGKSLVSKLPRNKLPLISIYLTVDARLALQKSNKPSNWLYSQLILPPTNGLKSIDQLKLLLPKRTYCKFVIDVKLDPEKLMVPDNWLSLTYNVCISPKLPLTKSIVPVCFILFEIVI